MLNAYRQHCAPESGVLADYSRVDLLAEHRAVVIDVKEVNGNSSCVSERLFPSGGGLHCQVVLWRHLIVQLLHHKDVTCKHKHSLSDPLFESHCQMGNCVYMCVSPVRESIRKAPCSLPLVMEYVVWEVISLSLLAAKTFRSLVPTVTSSGTVET